MIESMARKVSDYLVTQKAVKEEQQEVCRYGIEIFISTVLSFFLILTSGIITHSLWNAALYITIYATLRVYTGGYHADTYFKCNLYYVLIYMATLVCFRAMRVHTPDLVLWLLVVLGLMIVGCLAPIANVNKKLSAKEVFKYRNISVIVYFSISMLILVGDILKVFLPDAYVNTVADISLYIKILLLSVVILMLIAPKVSDTEVNGEQERR